MKIVAIAIAAVTALIAPPALAADLARPVYKAPPVPAPAPHYTWSGLYVGGHIGWGWVEEVRTVVNDGFGGAAFPPGFRFCCDRDGFLGGAQIGYNWQGNTNWLLGIEGDWSWTDSKVTKHPVSPFVPGLVMNAFANDKWYSTFTGRVGYVDGDWLFYGKGGGAALNSDRGATITGTAPLTPGVNTITVTTRNDTFWGWTVGAGLERRLWGSWSAKLEYDYLDFGKHNLNFVDPASGTVSTQGFDTQVHVIKAGLNYNFSGPY
jgi:outer membrane immunogenic protein